MPPPRQRRFQLRPGRPEGDLLRRAAALALLLALPFSAGCEWFRDRQRRGDVQRLLACVQQGRTACVRKLACPEAPEASSVRELMELAEILHASGVDALQLMDKQVLNVGQQYTFELDGLLFHVFLCPPGYQGSVATVVLD